MDKKVNIVTLGRRTGKTSAKWLHIKTVLMLGGTITAPVDNEKKINLMKSILVLLDLQEKRLRLQKLYSYPEGRYGVEEYKKISGVQISYN